MSETESDDIVTTDELVRLTGDMLSSLVEARIRLKSALDRLYCLKTLVLTIEATLLVPLRHVHSYVRAACGFTYCPCERTILAIDDAIQENAMRHHKLCAGVYHIRFLSVDTGNVATELHNWCNALILLRVLRIRT